MRLNREVPTLHEQEDRRDGRRSSNFDVKFDKLATSTKPVALASKKDLDNQFNDQISDPLTDNLRNRRNFNSNNNDEIRELRKVTAKPHRKYTAVTTSEKEFPQNLKSSSNCCFCCLCTCSRSRWNVTYKYLPPSMVDDYLNGPQRTAVTFMQLNMASAAVLIAAVIGIEFAMPTTFSREILISGAMICLPVHYALAIYGLLGFVNAFLILSLSCRGLLVTKVQPVLYSTVIVPLFGLFCLLHNLGACILFADKLEEKMLHELYHVGSSSTIWTGSQKFFGCCGVISKADWQWNQPFENELNFLFPISCCNLTVSKGKGCTYKQAIASRNGCLDSEMDLLLGISYSLMLLVSCNFIFELFGWMQIAKLSFRQKFRRKIFQTWIDDKSRLSSEKTRCELLTSNANTTNCSRKSMAQKLTKRFIGHKSEPHLVNEERLNSIEEAQPTVIKCSSTAT